MRRFLPLMLALLCALFIAGCFDYEESLELNADGSGTMAVRMTIYKKYFEMMAGMMGPATEDSALESPMFPEIKREDLEKKLRKSKSNVKLLDFKELQNDSMISYDMKYSFTNLQDMVEISENMGKSDMTSESGEVSGEVSGEESSSELSSEPAGEPKVTFLKDKSGQWQYARGFEAAEMGEMILPTEDSSLQESAVVDSTVPTDSLAEPFAEAVDTMMSQMGSMMTGMADIMTQAFGDHRVRMIVKFPGAVVESNATSVKDNTAVWEYKFIDLAKAPRQLQATIKP